MNRDTPQSPDLEALAVRVEAAKGLPAETAVLLDMAFAAIHGEKPCRIHGGSPELSAWLALHNPFFRMLEADAFESAALQLVPEGEGRWPQLEYIGPNPNNSRIGHRVWLWFPSGKFRGEHLTSFALAIAAAALRARASQ